MPIQSNDPPELNRIFGLEMRLIHPDGRREEMRMVTLDIPYRTHPAESTRVEITLHTRYGDLTFQSPYPLP